MLLVSGLVAIFLFASPPGLASADPRLPVHEKHPFRLFYPAPSAGDRPPAHLLSCGIDEDIVRLYLTEVAASAKSAPSGRDRLKRLAHQHAHFQERNRKLSLTLQAHTKQAKRGGAPVMDRKFFAEIHAGISSHPVAGKAGETKYDMSQKVGFCFGRAAYVHLELSRRGVRQEDMLKIFAFGKLLHTGMIWDFHVATAVLGSEAPSHTRKWWVIDSLFEFPLELDEWMKRVTHFSVLKTYPDVRFYATDPRKFQPVSGEYSSETLSNPAFMGYFEDLYQSFLPTPAASPSPRGF